VPILRFLYFYLIGEGDGHLQSLVLGGVLVLMGFISVLFALAADLIGFNRQLLETTLRKVRRMELSVGEASVFSPSDGIDDNMPISHSEETSKIPDMENSSPT